MTLIRQYTNYKKKQIDNMQISDLILYKDNQIIVFNKPGNMPVQKDKTEDMSLEQLAEIYTKGSVYVVHRIDRPASGVVIFAKTKTAVQQINAQFRARTVKKTYYAVMKNQPPETEGTLVHYLTKNEKNNKSKAAGQPAPGSKRAELNFKIIDKSDNYFLAEVELITGRHHQIRAQFAAVGSPIKGDVKYGARRGNKDRSIHLHARTTEFAHPVTGEKISVTAPVPGTDPVWSAFGNPTAT